jgi:hypothetical protein
LRLLSLHTSRDATLGSYGREGFEEPSRADFMPFFSFEELLQMVGSVS